MAKHTPVLTQSLKMHINGGSKFSVLEYNVLADGQPTGIVLHQETNGSPQFRYTCRELRFRDEMLNLMVDVDPEVEKWILERLAPATPESDDEDSRDPEDAERVADERLSAMEDAGNRWAEDGGN